MADTTSTASNIVDKLRTNRWVIVVYFAVVLLLLIMIVWSAHCAKKASQTTEHLIGGGIQDKIFTSGATMRRLGTEFSGTDQGQYTTVHNAELKEMIPGIVSGKERLVSGRGEPDFWEISGELAAYRDEASTGMASDIAAGKEHFAAGTVADAVEDDLLRNTLWR